MKKGIIIGVDPDTDKSGCATVDTTGEKTAIELRTIAFPALVEYLIGQAEKTRHTQNLAVIVEAGWLNRSNWHLTRYDTKASAAAKGNATGRNHETGRKIIEMCQYHGIPACAVKPLRKCWRGTGGKITHDELEAVTGHKIGRCNQDARDALLLAWVYADLPLRRVVSKK